MPGDSNMLHSHWLWRPHHSCLSYLADARSGRQHSSVPWQALQVGSVMARTAAKALQALSLTTLTLMPALMVAWQGHLMVGTALKGWAAGLVVSNLAALTGTDVMLS